MAKRFKLRISRVIPSFQSCRSKDPSTHPQDPVPSFLRLSPTTTPTPNPTPPPPPSSNNKPHHGFSFKRHVSSAFTSVGCGLASKTTPRYASSSSPTESSPPQFKWQKEDKWHVVDVSLDDDTTSRQKIYNSSADSEDDPFPFPPPPPAPPSTAEKKKRRGRKKKTTAKLRISTSSAESGLFSEEETETLVSSRSFSTDSSTDFNPQLKTIRETAAPISSRRRRKKGRRREKRGGGGGGESPARLSVFKRLIPCGVEGKVKESFAVVKKSEDPYEDFRRSMVEMILEKQMFEERELEQLLQCFLSLNSKHHHGVIVEAFAEIWEALFCGRNSTHRRVSTAL